MRAFSFVVLASLILILLPAQDASAIHSVGSVTPSALGQGATSQNLDIAGSNFLPGATVSFSPATGITLNSTTRNSSSSITVNVTIASDAATGARTVTVNNPLEGAASCAGCFTINTGPVPTSASPNALGQGTSEQTVTLTGTGFVTGAIVSISGTGITVGTTTVINATTMTVVLSVSSAATTGARNITVTNTDHGAGTCTGCLTINDGPTVSSVSPPAGSNGGSATLTVTGTHFVSGATVRLKMTGQSDIVASPVTFNSPTSLTAGVNLSVAAPGAWDVVVTNPDHGSGTCAACFTVAGALPTVTSAAPDKLGQGASSVDVVVAGTHFANGATVTVSGSGVTVGTVTVTSPTSLTVVLSVSSSAATTARDITVTNTNNQAGVCTGCLTIQTGPTVTLISPTTRGQGAADQPFSITGTGFVAGATVSFSGTGITVGTVTVGPATSISTTISVSSLAATGARDVIVTNPDHGQYTCAGCFTVNAGPTATSLSPNAVGQGVTNQNVTVTGTGFVNGATVAFSGTGITVNLVTFGSATSLTVNIDVAPNAPTGARNVTVTNPDAGTNQCAACFTVTESPAITSATPDHLGQGATSQVVALVGTGFQSGATITVSGTGVTPGTATVVDSTHLNVPITVGSAAATGARTLTVHNTDGGTGSCADCFSITPRPVATGLNPSALGQGSSNVVVTLTGGSGFASGMTVSVEGTGVTVGTVTVTNATTATVVLSVSTTATTGTRDVTLTNTDHGTSICADCLTINDGPTVTSVSPPAASNNGSANISITGTHFVDGATVTLTKSSQPDIEGTNVQFVSDTTLTATVDLTLAAPGPWTVVVTNPDHGTGSCASCFTVAASAPTVTSADPNVLSQGASNVEVALTGTNFANGAVVNVSGTGVTVGTVTVDSSTSLSVILSASGTAPTGARDITVTNTDGQSGVCTGCLTIQLPPTITSINPAQRGQGLTNQDLQVTGARFVDGATITFSGTGITVNTVTFGSATSLTVNIDVAPGAALGFRNVTVTNPDGASNACLACFKVTGPTSVSFTPPAATTGSVVVTFSQPVSGISSSNVFLRLTGTLTTVASTLTCSDQVGAAVNCSTGSVKTVSIKPSAALLPGQYYTAYVAPNGSPAIVDYGGLTVAPATGPFRASTNEQETSTSAAYYWRGVSSSSAYGGSYALDHFANSQLTFKFTGTGITWYTNAGRNYGLAYVYIDGVLKGSFNQFASSTHYRVARNFGGLTSAAHTITIRVRGLKGSTGGTGTDIAVDAFQVGATRFDTPSVTYSWRRAGTSLASGGAYALSDGMGSATTFTFRGTGFDWYTVLGPSMGKANVYVDGVLIIQFDNYASSTQYNVRRTFRKLSDSIHTVTIKLTGTRRSSSSGTLVGIDRWVVI